MHEDLEFYSVIRAIKALDESDVAVIVLMRIRLSQQDLTIYRMAIRKKRGIIVAVNKWDLIEKDDKTMLCFEEHIKSKLAPFNDVPSFISVLEKQRIFKLVDEIENVYNRMTIKVPGFKAE